MTVCRAALVQRCLTRRQRRFERGALIIAAGELRLGRLALELQTLLLLDRRPPLLRQPLRLAPRPVGIDAQALQRLDRRRVLRAPLLEPARRFLALAPQALARRVARLCGADRLL